MHEIIHGECLAEMSKLPAQSVDLILSDLPYGTTRNRWDVIIPFEALWEQYWRIARPNAAIVLTAQCPFDKVLGASQIQYLRYEWIWHKPAGTGFLNAKKQPLKNHENILVFYRKQPPYYPQMREGFKPYRVTQGHGGTNYGETKGALSVSEGERYPISVLTFSRDAERYHPTQKPVALFEYLIRTYTNPGDTVLDNCAGSGTTAVAAKRADRKSISIEQDAEYVEIIRKRLG